MKSKAILRKNFYFFFVIQFFLFFNGLGQTYFNMSSGNYTQNFADIINWTNNYASGSGANNWKVAATATGSTVNNATVFVTGTVPTLVPLTMNLTFLQEGSGSVLPSPTFGCTFGVAEEVTLDAAIFQSFTLLICVATAAALFTHNSLLLSLSPSLEANP